MTSAKRQAANQTNAHRSTGPKTEQGTIKKEESKTTFEMPSAGGVSEAFRKASILGTPVFQGMENKFFDMQELTLEKSKFEETDLHEAKDIRERRLDSFSNYEENTCKQDYRKSSEEIEKPKQEPVNPGLLIQINKSKMTNNEGGAVTVQNNMIVINKKRKHKRECRKRRSRESWRCKKRLSKTACRA